MIGEAVDARIDAIDALTDRLEVDTRWDGAGPNRGARAAGGRRFLGFGLVSGHGCRPVQMTRAVNTPGIARIFFSTDSGTSPSMSISV